ncbi:hypothetical protein [Cronobacter sakazakii]|uniref:hypothetical protein n=1 Tax=Cronobacter sakazakii TaxID=28141 RepID=UPI000E0186A0|nr:hypothetical protein [Cronobacter sakazakii]STD07490.1 Uncharacterised protein [Cronobacter sakazakii]
MVMKTKCCAPAPTDHDEWQPDPCWDCSPELQLIERDTLINLAQYVVGRNRKNWPNSVRQRLSRLILPLRAVLKSMNAALTTTNSAIHDIILEMHRLEKTYWSWTQEDWLEVLCSNEEAFRKKYGSCGNCRQYASRLPGYCADLIDLRLRAAFIITGFLSKFLGGQRQRQL